VINIPTWLVSVLAGVGAVLAVARCFIPALRKPIVTLILAVAALATVQLFQNLM
jgi:hypothetical protein